MQVLTMSPFCAAWLAFVEHKGFVYGLSFIGLAIAMSFLLFVGASAIEGARRARREG